MKWKIILPVAGILVVLVIITTLFSSIRFTAYTGFLFHERITVAASGLKKFIADCKSNTRIASVTAAANKNIINAIKEQDVKKIALLLQNSLDLYHVDFFVVTDKTGMVLSRTLLETSGDSIINQSCIQEAVNGNVYTCIEKSPHTEASIRTGAPVFNENGELIGVVSAGIRLDSNKTLEDLKDHYNTDFSLIVNSTRVATTISMNGEYITGTELNPYMTNRIYTEKKEYFGNVDILGKNYSTFYWPFLNEKGEVFAIIAAASSNDKFIQERNIMLGSIILIGVSGLAASILVLLLIISRITKPVNRLTYLVSEVTNGNTNVDIDRTAASKDEIGLLTLDIYSLVGVIKMILSDLSHLTVDMNNFSNTDIKIDTEKYSGSYREIIKGIMKLAGSVSMMRKTMAAMDYLDTMITVVDLDYNLLYVNRITADAYGINRENYIGKKCYKTIKNLDRPCNFCQLPGLLTKKDEYPFVDYDNLLDETSGIYIGGKAALIRWIDGAQVFFNSFKDVTPKIKYQEQLRRAMMDAKAASVAKSAFLANMSHEIRTPMNSIIGFSELALDNEVTPITREYLSIIQESGKGLLQIINDILDISKVESGVVELETIPFELNELLNSCRSITMPRAIEKNITLQFYAESIKGRKLLGDPTRLRQVLLNLLSNAVKFTDAGSVKLSVVIYSETENSVTLRFEVQDSGIGMTGDQLRKLFEPFVQADISTTRKYGGTGLGLAIAKNIVELMGSELEIKSEPGTGTAIAFVLTFNTTDTIDDKTVEEVNAVRKLDKPTFEGEVLVCEDNVVNQRVITEHLTRVGLKAEIAENGQEGIDKVCSRIDKGVKPFDLILMDIHMPVMDGIEATPKIIKLGTGTPIVAMTANIMVEEREMYSTLGMHDYIGKPFTSQELWRCLLKYLKPVAFRNVPNHEDQQEDYDAKLQMELKSDFVKSNKNRFEEIKSAIDTGDIKLAHRLVHTLKSNAALIGKALLQNAAAEVEAALKNGENRATETQLYVLQSRLAIALDELVSYLSKIPSRLQPEKDSGFNADEARELIEKLEPLLRNRNPECLKMIDALKMIPGSEEVIRQMDDFSFGEAAETLSGLKEKLEASHWTVQ